MNYQIRFRNTVFALTCITMSFCSFLSVGASAEPSVVNGSFSGTVTTSNSSPWVLPGWVVVNSTPEVGGDGSFTNNTGIPWASSPDGGTFVKMNGTVDPTYQEAISQTINGFTIGETYHLRFYQVNLGFYYAIIDQWNTHEGYIEFYLDDNLVDTSEVIQAAANYDDPIQWSSGSISFVATNTTHTLKINARSTALVAEPTTSRTTTGYVAIDGLAFTSEDCSNGLDDDGDGLIDDNDPDCTSPPPPPPAGQPNHVSELNVRCMHEPLYPQLGDTVTVTARAIDSLGDIVVPDFAEIYVNNLDSPAKQVNNQAAVHSFEVTAGQLSYGCRVGKGTHEATSWFSLDKKLRSVDVGSLNNPGWKAVPVYYSGAVDSKIDIVFFHDDDEYNGYDDPAFLADVQLLIEEGLFTIPWFVEYQWAFNFWIATASDANAGPKADSTSSTDRCLRQPPASINEDYAYRDAGAIVHTSVCRDNARSKIFTIEMNPKRLQVVAHEIGHVPFGLADEYCQTKDGAVFCDGGYFTAEETTADNYSPRFPNLFATEAKCRTAAQDPLLYFAPDDCRALPESVGGMDTWWIGEPELNIGIPKLDEIRDLMQQTGGISDSAGNTLDRYKVGNSEINRMNWIVFATCLNDKEC